MKIPGFILQWYLNNITFVASGLICAFLAIYGNSLFEMLSGAIKKWHVLFRFIVFVLAASLGMSLLGSWGIELISRFLRSQPSQTSFLIALGGFLGIALFAKGKGYY